MQGLAVTSSLGGIRPIGQAGDTLMVGSLDALLLVALAGIPLSALLAGHRLGRWLLVLLYVAQLGLLATLAPGTTGHSSRLAFSLLGNPVGWQLDALG